MNESKEVKWVKKKTIWDLDLHEELWVWDWLRVIRVPGGFIYIKYDLFKGDLVPRFSNMVFVPEPKRGK